jgi:hypothetical protein
MPSQWDASYEGGYSDWCPRTSRKRGGGGSPAAPLTAEQEAENLRLSVETKTWAEYQARIAKELV